MMLIMMTIMIIMILMMMTTTTTVIIMMMMMIIMIMMIMVTMILTTTTTTTTTTTSKTSNNNDIEKLIWRFLLSTHSTSNCLQPVNSGGQGAVVCKSRATHRALITCNMSSATWYEGTAQLLRLARLKSESSVVVAYFH